MLPLELLLLLFGDPPKGVAVAALGWKWTALSAGRAWKSAAVAMWSEQRCCAALRCWTGCSWLITPGGRPLGLLLLLVHWRDRSAKVVYKSSGMPKLLRNRSGSYELLIDSTFCCILASIFSIILLLLLCDLAWPPFCLLGSAITSEVRSTSRCYK